jgi:hypothetical protein
MSLDALIMLAGFLVAILPFLGFPIQWDNIILVILGVVVIALGIFVRRRGSLRGTSPSQEQIADSATRHEGSGQ